MRHPLHVALSVEAPERPPAPATAATPRARHRKPPVRVTLLPALASVPPARRVAAGLGLASVLAATMLTAVVNPSAPTAPDRVPAGPSSNLAQVSRD
ncbi:hypothetical protein [Streptomyces sp. G-G2]|uniref:hypothetical protein n=1 Tax=Streptomyces sp. G-G2 TaxID=3046201 RepID=UPI0024B8E014|nr:hypothetical protein [Streptomyces sp. G-G2]MDJ0383864.1 hypothetical protein [Streptomyces sp. G-G2]